MKKVYIIYGVSTPESFHALSMDDEIWFRQNKTNCEIHQAPIERDELGDSIFGVSSVPEKTPFVDVLALVLEHHGKGTIDAPYSGRWSEIHVFGADRQEIEDAVSELGQLELIQDGANYLITERC